MPATSLKSLLIDAQAAQSRCTLQEQAAVKLTALVAKLPESDAAEAAMQAAAHMMKEACFQGAANRIVVLRLEGLIAAQEGA